MSRWLTEAAADPFLGAAALRGPPNSVLALYRSQARAILSEFSTRLLPEEPIRALQAVSLALNESAALALVLKQLGPAMDGLVCRRSAPESPAGTELAKLVSAGDLFWAERRAVMVVEKQEFAHDREIYCKGDKLLAMLQNIVSAAARACKAARPGSKMARNCAAAPQHGTPAIEAEIKDVEKEKEFNRHKLRQKWPEGVMAGLTC